MHGEPVKKKTKLIIPSARFQNNNNIGFDTAKSTSSYTHWTLYIASLLTFFRSDPPFSGLSNSFSRSNPSSLDHKKIDEKPIGEFLWRGICRRINIKDFLLKQASLYKYTWEVVACIVIIGKGRLGPDIWLEIPNHSTHSEDMIFTTWYSKAIKQKEINFQ